MQKGDPAEDTGSFSRRDIGAGRSVDIVKFLRQRGL